MLHESDPRSPAEEQEFVEVTALPPQARAARGVVFVTGATAGIGLAASLALIDKGFHVIATARRPHRSPELLAAAREGKATLMALDVGDPRRIEEVGARTAELLADAGINALAGLVNNAGSAMIGPAETVGVDQLRRHFEINVFGQIGLTQALLPLLRAGRGRIVNMGSVAAWITMPFLGPLAASKAAFRALNDALRLELKPAGVRVILLEPGRVNSDAPDKLLDDLDPVVARMSAARQADYAVGFRIMINRFVGRAKTGRSPQLTADAVVAALTDAHPRSRQPIGGTARRLILMSRMMPNPVLDRVRYHLFGLKGFARDRGR